MRKRRSSISALGIAIVRALESAKPADERLLHDPEVDHPASQASKRKKLQRIFGEVPSHVIYVPVEFETQSLQAELTQAGYAPTLKTLVIWQGVTQYLTPAAVDATLTFVLHNTAPDSTIIFDYATSDTIEGAGHHGEVRNLRRYRWLSGEDLTFGIPTHQIEPFLLARGFRNIVNLDHTELAARYFADSKRSVAEGYAIALARTGSEDNA